MTDNDRIELEALITEREGMISENKERERNGFMPTFNKYNFYRIAEKIRALKQEGGYKEVSTDSKELVTITLEGGNREILVSTRDVDGNTYIDVEELTNGVDGRRKPTGNRLSLYNQDMENVVDALSLLRECEDI